MILTDREIKQAIKDGSIVIDPFNEKCLGSNSYDVHLSKHFAVYEDKEVLDAKKDNPISRFEITDSGFVLKPGVLYLASTIEYTETHIHVPYLEGKSSTGRLGIDIHATAGKGDIGFCNYWTLEISCIRPVKVYPGMPIGQITYFVAKGEVINPYNSKENAKYINKDPRPMGSMMWKNVF